MKEAKTASAGPPLRVLVVEDSPDAADALRILLELSGFEVAVAHDAEEALAMLRDYPAELGYLDIGMPGMDGYELARRIRAAERPMYLVAVTGWGQQKDVAAAFAAGFDEHLTKPAAPDRIVAIAERRAMCSVASA